MWAPLGTILGDLICSLQVLNCPQILPLPTEAKRQHVFFALLLVLTHVLLAMDELVEALFSKLSSSSGECLFAQCVPILFYVVRCFIDASLMMYK